LIKDKGTKNEQRIMELAARMKKLKHESRDYIYKLTHVLFLTEQTLIKTSLDKLPYELGYKKSVT